MDSSHNSQDGVSTIGIGAAAAAVIAAAAVYRWMADDSDRQLAAGPTPLLCDLGGGRAQSIVLPDGSRTSRFAPNGQLQEFFFEDAKTLHEAFLRGLRVSGNGPCLGTRDGDGPYQWQSYQEVYDTAQAVGSWMRLQAKLQRGDIVSVYAQNRSEWVACEQACNQFAFVLVPLYDTLGADACTYILQQTEAALLVADCEEKATKLLRAADLPSSLRHLLLICSSEPGAELQKAAEAAGVQLHLWQQAVRLGQQDLQPVDPPAPDDLATMCYTSGTTGLPKGVQLTHKNIVSNISGILKNLMSPEVLRLGVAAELSPADRYLSYLPLAHMFERCALTMVFVNGMRCGFFRGDVRQLLEDMQELKPTLFATVPRLLNRIYDRVTAGVAGSRVKRWLLQLAVQRKTKMLQRGVIRNDTVWDRLVFRRVHGLTGGCIRLVITGSAPIGAQVMEFTRAAFGCPVFEGYGQTEAAAAVTITMPGDPQLGHVGPPAACCLVKLADVPEMGYSASSGQGEVCVRGPNVFSGYFKQPEKTAEAFDADGWLLTGDIGEWTPEGCLRIIDRRKHLFKLAQGEYVAPEKIEQALNRSQFVAQVFVDGSSLEVCVLGVVVPDAEVVLPWAKARGLAQDMEQLCAGDSPLKAAILEDLTRIGRQSGLKGFELCKDVHLHPELFSVENGLLTPTFKSKRPELRSRFRPQFDAMYQRLRAAT